MSFQFRLLCIVFLCCCTSLFGQNITKNVPVHANAEGRYIFYLHGAIIQEKGINAVSPDYGKYEYTNILLTLKKRGFDVISEARKKDTEVADYASKVAHQVGQLLEAGVPPHRITVVGASLGAYMALESSKIINNSEVKFVLMGLCGDYAVNLYKPEVGNFQGNFLSIFERSDSKGSCAPIFTSVASGSKFNEIELTMGNDHGFLYKPYDEWVDPVTEFAKSK